VPIADPLVMPLALELLDCYRQELAKLADPPANIGIRPGATVDFLMSTVRDECCEGLGWVRPAAFYPASAVFPVQDPAPQKTGVLGWAITLDLGYVRCAPTPDENEIPDEDTWLSVTQGVMDAAAAMRRAICCFIDADRANRLQKVLPGIWQPVDVEGGCVGGILPVTLRGPACDCADAGPTSS
jgi:hypothetical protein